MVDESIAHLGLASDARPPVDSWSGERTPPHDLLAEQSALGGMLLSRAGKEVDDVMSVVEPRDFYIPKHEVLAQTIGRLHLAGKPTDVISATDELTKAGQLQRAGGAEYLHTLTGLVPTAANAGYYATIVAEKAVLRRLVEAGMRIVQMGYASEGEAADLLSNARAEVDAISVVKQRALHMIGDGLLDLADELEAKPHYLPSAWETIDTMIGGFAPGELAIVAARPGDGKSILMLQQAMRAARSGTVAFVSLEMTERELQLRMVSQVAEIPMTSLRNHTLNDINWKKYADARAHVMDAPVFVDDSGTATLATIRSHARAVAQRGPLAMIVIDYVQLVDGPKSAENRTQEVAAVTRGLKRIAKDLDVPVVAAAQLNRGAPGRGSSRPVPTLRDLRESGGLEQDADTVMLLHRDPEKRPNDLDVIVAKNRHGAIGKVTLRWQAEYARVLDKQWSPMGPLFTDEEHQ